MFFKFKTFLFTLFFLISSGTAIAAPIFPSLAGSWYECDNGTPLVTIGLSGDRLPEHVTIGSQDYYDLFSGHLLEDLYFRSTKEVKKR